MFSNLRIRRKVYAFFLILSLCALQAPVLKSHLALPYDMTSGKDISFLHVRTSTANDTALACSGLERFRNRASALSVILFNMQGPLTSLVDGMYIFSLVLIYILWNTAIGDELSALPQSDMVSRK